MFVGPDHYKYAAVIRLLHIADRDVIEGGAQTRVFFMSGVSEDSRYISSSRNSGELYHQMKTYYEVLGPLGFVLREGEDEASFHYFVYIVLGGVNGDCLLPVEYICTMVSILLKLGANISATDRIGRQALHWAFSIEDFQRRSDCRTTIDLATVLLENGADPCALDNYGYSSFDYAVLYDLTDAWYQALRQAGLDASVVERKTKERKWLFLCPGEGFARSTSIDKDLTRPATEGFLRRRALAGDRLED